MVTIRAVRRHEELTRDCARVSASRYLADPKAHVWDKRRTFCCHCGSAQCREMIDGYTVIGHVRDLVLGAAVSVVATTGKGRGLIAARNIVGGEIVARSPVFVIPEKEWREIEATPIYDYTFEWGEDRGDAAVMLGIGSLVNHSYSPNTVFVRRYAACEIDFIALRDIATGEEITTNYNGDPDDRSPLWFEVAD